MKILKNPITIFALVTIIGGGTAAYFYINRDIKTTDTENTETSNEKIPLKAASKISPQPIVNATIDANNIIKFYALSNGQTFSIPANGGEATLVDDTILSGISSVEWAPTEPYVLTTVQNRVYSYNFVEDQSFAFPIDVNSAQFLSDNKVFYTYQNSNGAVDISVSEPDGSNWKKVITLTSNAVFLKPIPFRNSISQTLIPSSYRASALRIINIDTGEAISVLDEKNGLNVSWAPSGDIGIISYTTERGGGKLSLSIVDKSGFEVSKIPDVGTIAEKVVWSKDAKTAYFTRPEVSNTKILPDDYYTSSLGDFNESLYKIDIATATISQISTNIGSVDSFNLFLNSAENELFFINRRDNHLYKVPLR